MNSVFSRALALRARLHEIPEASGCEVKTKRLLMQELTGACEVHDCGAWFYAAHREEGAECSLCFRADMDAVSGGDGTVYHGCGHDGHMSVMAALASEMAGRKVGKNLFFLFQHAEETGEGAKEACGIFDREKIDAIFGFHNCPGYPEGTILFREDVFACASRGLILTFTGVQSHAAYPENGRNPAFPMAAVLSRLPEISSPSRYRGMTLVTPVGFSAGSHAFGVAAGRGELCLTLRAWYDQDLELLEDTVFKAAVLESEKAGISVTREETEVFTATRNDKRLLPIAARAAETAGLPAIMLQEPFRWSEDFGCYGTRTKAFYFGVGGGEKAAGLHTPEYQWNDCVTQSALDFLIALAEQPFRL